MNGFFLHSLLDMRTLGIHEQTETGVTGNEIIREEIPVVSRRDINQRFWYHFSCLSSPVCLREGERSGKKALVSPHSSPTKPNQGPVRWLTIPGSFHEQRLVIKPIPLWSRSLSLLLSESPPPPLGVKL